MISQSQLHKEAEAMAVIADALMELPEKRRRAVFDFVEAHLADESLTRSAKTNGNAKPEGFVMSEKKKGGARSKVEETMGFVKTRDMVNADEVANHFGISVSGARQRLLAAAKQSRLQVVQGNRGCYRAV